MNCPESALVISQGLRVVTTSRSLKLAMGYGWCYAHRVYGFSGTLDSSADAAEQLLEISEKTLEKMGIEVFLESVYKCVPTGVVYGISISAEGMVDPETKRKVDRALDYVNKKYGLSLSCGYHLCVDTDMTEMDVSGDSGSDSDVSSEYSEGVAE